RRRRRDAFPVGVEAEQAARRTPGGDRARPHAPAALAPYPRPRHGSDPRPLHRRRGRHLRHPGARPGRCGARRRPTAGERPAAPVLLQRQVRVSGRIRLLGWTTAIRTERALAAALLGVAALSWWLTIGRMDGMDNGPWTGLGTLGWFLGV